MISEYIPRLTDLHEGDVALGLLPALEVKVEDIVERVGESTAAAAGPAARLTESTRKFT